MPFIKDILRYKSISFVGLEKNTGKTETLNYVLSRLCSFSNIKIGLTSIGIDGEKEDQVTLTAKPQITIDHGTLFVTAEGLYRQKEIVANILNISQRQTALGRLVFARSETKGKILLGGAGNTTWLKEVIAQMHSLGADLVLVDGALSRMSFGSPSITQAMILSTGAALSASLKTVVKKTAFVYQMTQLPQIDSELANKLSDIDSGIYAITQEKEVIDLSIPSILMIEKYKDKLFSQGKRLFVSGIITDKLISFLRTQKDCQRIEIIIKDFTRVFSSPEQTNMFLQKGGKISVVQRTNLIAITVNPFSPTGYNFKSQELISSLQQEIPLPIYNIKENADL